MLRSWDWFIICIQSCKLDDNKLSNHKTLDGVEKELRDVVAFDRGIKMTYPKKEKKLNKNAKK